MVKRNKYCKLVMCNMQFIDNHDNYGDCIILISSSIFYAWLNGWEQNFFKIKKTFLSVVRLREHIILPLSNQICSQISQSVTFKKKRKGGHSRFSLFTNLAT